MNAGYSGTPLVRKLGIKPGYTLKFFHPPQNYLTLFDGFPEDTVIREKSHPDKVDFVHYFIQNLDDFYTDLPMLKKQIKQEGRLWISWDKTRSKIKGHANGNIIREIVLKTGLVDIKVCAVDETWSALLFVYRKENRGKSQLNT